MVQYFRNYIVRPAGSLSGTSTVDSLSSSFICTVNESNTLVPPPYSRANSPDRNSSLNSSIPRSASHHICLSDINCFRFNTAPFATATTTRNKNHNVLRLSESANFENINRKSIATGSNMFSNTVILSRSDQEFKYNIVNATTGASSTSSISNNMNNAASTTVNLENNMLTSDLELNNVDKSIKNSNSNINENIIINNMTNSYNSTNVFSDVNKPTNTLNSCDSYGSIGEFSIIIPDNLMKNADRNVSMSQLADSINKSCQILHNFNKTKQNVSFNSEESPINMDIVKKFESIRSLVNSNTGSAVSSLANIDSPSSPPRATSPTAEVRELLEQINKLHNADLIESRNLDKSVFKSYSDNHYTPLLGENGTTSNTNTIISNSGQSHNDNYNNSTTPPITMTTTRNKRPSSLQTRKSKFLNKTTKCLYTPIIDEHSKLTELTSPTAKSSTSNNSSSIRTTNRCKRSWISRSAPTTPGSLIPSNRTGDNSPLLFDHDEEYEQNV